MFLHLPSRVHADTDNPRIVMVSNAYYPADPRLRRQAETLAERGYAVEVLCQRKPGELVEEDVRGVHVRRIGTARYRGASLAQYFLSNAAFFLSAMAALIRGQLRHSYAMVQVYSMPEALLLCAIGPRLAGVPLIYDAGDLTTELFASKFGKRGGPLLAMLLRAQERFCLSFADGIVTVHEDYRQRLLARGVPADRLRIAMNLPDPRLIERALEMPCEPSPDEFVLVHHGSLVHRYGADLAVRAVARLRDRIPSLRLRLYGDGDLRPTLVGLIDELNIADQVTLHPDYVPLDALLPMLASADAAIVPHRADAFTHTILPNKLMEYLALGLPTVVTRTRTVQWHIPEDAVDYCEANDVEAMADAIERLWNDPRHRRDLAARARTFSAAHSWTEAATAYCSDVDELAAVRHRRRTALQPTA